MKSSGKVCIRAASLTVRDRFCPGWMNPFPSLAKWDTIVREGSISTQPIKFVRKILGAINLMSPAFKDLRSSLNKGGVFFTLLQCADDPQVIIVMEARYMIEDESSVAVA